jgi:hypothetical protein
MSRPASGDAQALMDARQAIASAQTVEQLRQAQAVVLPIDYGLSLAETAQVIGVSPGCPRCQNSCRLRFSAGYPQRKRHFMHRKPHSHHSLEFKEQALRKLAIAARVQF